MQTDYDRTDRVALEILQDGVNLPPLPAVFTRLLALTRQPEDRIDVNKFAVLLQTDPSLTARILQLANSSYFGTLNKITSPKQAVMHIGLQETISTVNWILCQEALPKFPVMEGFSDKDYWAHSWACATANRMLGSPQMGFDSQPGELYVTGLLHGIGRLILAIHKPKEFKQCLQLCRDFSQPLEEAEMDILGTTDTRIAYEILKTWQFPESICNGVKYFNNPEGADEKYREIAAITQFAYYIATTSGIGSNGDKFSFDIRETYLAQQENPLFSNEATRTTLLAKIEQTLKQKATAITGVAVEDASPESANFTPSEQLDNPPPSPQKENNFFTRCTSYLKNLFR